MEEMTFYLIGHNSSTSVHNNKDLNLEHFLLQHSWKYADKQEDAQILICIDAPGSLVTRPKALKSITGQRSIFILQEPSVVWPNNADEEFISAFNKVIRVGREHSPYDPICWPIPWPLELSNNFSKEKLERAVMIASNRLSFWPRELYSLRREVVARDMEVDVFGRDWNLQQHQKILRFILELITPLARGRLPRIKSGRHYLFLPSKSIHSIEDKIAVNSRYKVSLVIENSSEYLSEKLLEAIISGSIPVYVGAEPGVFNIPPELYVRSEPDIDSIKLSIERALGMDHAVWSKLAQKWLLSDSTKREWSIEFFWQRLVELMLDLRKD